MRKKIKELSITEFEKRMKQFLDELEEIKREHNKNNHARKITDTRDETISQYIQWRILNELKKMNQKW